MPAIIEAVTVNPVPELGTHHLVIELAGSGLLQNSPLVAKSHSGGLRVGRLCFNQTEFVKMCFPQELSMFVGNRSYTDQPL
jgi:hypothetical protein